MRLADVKLGQTENSTATTGPVQVIAMTAGERQSGKTTIALSLARALARAGQRTMLLDADLGNSNIDGMLGLERGHTLFDVLHGHCSLADVIQEVENGLILVPAAAGIGQLSEMDSRQCAGLVHAVSELREPLDTLIVDTSSLFPECVARFCRAATEILLIIDSAPDSVARAIEHMDMLSGSYAIRSFRVLFNQVESAVEGRAQFDRLLSSCADSHEYTISYTGYVPRDAHFDVIMREHTSLVSSYPDSHAASAINRLAGRVISWPVSHQAAGHLEFFIDRLIHNENTSVEVTA